MIQDTIAAIATPKGRGGISIVRISGSNALEIAKKIVKLTPASRKAIFTVFYDNKGKALDEGIVLFFQAPNSFTGEDILELQGHGGPIIADLLLAEVLTLGARLARPGEFSERAFLNNKMDLTQAEAVADLIEASSAAAARCAMRSLQGEFSKQIHAIVNQIIQLRLFIEAALDFPTEEIDFLSESTIRSDIESVIINLENLYHQAKQGLLYREGIHLVIAGKPNAGKSSLLNSLTGKDAAIVTDIPGTTRDMLKESLEIDGIPVQIMDTAGLRETTDIIEKEGVRRTRQVLKQADVILWIMDIQDEDFSQLEEITPYKIPVIIIKNKIDTVNCTPEKSEWMNYVCISLSAKFNLGIDLLKSHLKHLLGINVSAETVFIARQRHLQAMEKALMYLKLGISSFTSGQSSELMAEELKQAQLMLSEITGEFTTDDLLGKIFSTFCIGK